MTDIIKPIHVIKDVGSLLRALRHFKFIKKVSVEVHENRKFVLRLSMPWYYIFPFSTYQKIKILIVLNKHKEPGAKIMISNLFF